MRSKRGGILVVVVGAAAVVGSSCGSSSSNNTAVGTTITGLPTTASPVQQQASCQGSQLHASRLATAAAAGHIVVTYGLRNVSGAPCTLFGYPGLQMIDASGKPLPTQVSHSGSYTFVAETPTPLSLSPQAEASFYAGYTDVPTGGETSCPQSARLEITPPNDPGKITLTDQIAPCKNGSITVSPVHAGTATPP
jgi:hypothetical protein